MKKVIFVGSTAYSGSTFFDLTLGNDPKGFSVGELYAYFNPTLPHHVAPLCSCGDPDCSLWAELKEVPQEDIYEAIFKRFPDVEFIVDSSKEPFWIEQQSAALRKKGIKTDHIVIWKTPLEIANSYKKRGLLHDWEKSWVNYHRLYMTLIQDWRAVKYRDYVQNVDVLEHICAVLGLTYFEGKERYWEKTHHILFGNDSARLHLQPDSLSVQGEGVFQRTEVEQYQTIFYQQVQDKALIDQVSTEVDRSAYISHITDLLEMNDVRHDHVPNEQSNLKDTVRLPAVNVGLRSMRRQVRYAVGKMRHT